jgi:multidrug resistance efflux pump
VRELERALAAQRAARAEAEAAAARERAAAGGRATAAELQEMIKALQVRLRRCFSRVRQHVCFGGC